MIDLLSAAERNRRVGQRFGKAASDYDAFAEVQGIAAERLADRITALSLPAHPRILEIGCGTGMFTRTLAARIGAADWTVTDISETMLATAQRGLQLPGSSRFIVVDGERPDVTALGEARRYDLICSNFAVQWFEDLNQGLAALSALLAPGGVLAISTLARDTFREWRDAHRTLSLQAATPHYPAVDAIDIGLADNGTAPLRPRRRWHRHVDAEHIVMPQHNGLNFVRGLKKIGATAPADGHTPLPVPALKRVIAAFNQTGANVTYHIAYGVWQQNDAAPQGVFVTGTDTGVGKTLISAVLARAWGADYWKPLQTGIADEAGDTPTVREFASLTDERVHAPAYALQAPLSPWAAAPLEQVVIDTAALALPNTPNTLVVEGAGGLFVPVDEQCMMIDLIDRFGLPTVLVARSGLGTINHTLLSLEALRQRRLPVLGVVMVGAPSASNRQAIERFGGVPVIAEIPHLDVVNAAAVEQLAQQMPSFADCLALHSTANPAPAPLA